MPIEPIKRGKISDEIFEQIKALIVSGEWKPGEKICSENDLAQMFQVSRVSIRSAISHLSALGLLQSKHGEGTFVGEVTPQSCMNSLLPMLVMAPSQLIEVYEFRKIIDVGSAKLAALNAEQADIDAMEDNIRQMKSSQCGVECFAELDVAFHWLLAQATKNSVMIKVYTIIKEILLTEQTKQHSLFGPSGGLKYHPLVLEAVKNRDGNLAAVLMEEHLEKSIEKLKKSVI